jgi:hypothetical protein
MKAIKLLAIAVMVGGLAGCAAHIRGVANTNVAQSASFTGKTFSVQQVDGDQLVGKKIGMMVGKALSLNGMSEAGSNSDYIVKYAFDVVPDGELSSANTVVTVPSVAPQIQGNANVIGNPPPTVAYASTSTSKLKLFKKTIAISIWDQKTNERMWEGEASETGWCDQIFVTSPQILSLMFSDFPDPLSNAVKKVDANDEFTKKVRSVFPDSTSWACQMKF